MQSQQTSAVNTHVGNVIIKLITRAISPNINSRCTWERRIHVGNVIIKLNTRAISPNIISQYTWGKNRREYNLKHAFIDFDLHLRLNYKKNDAKFIEYEVFCIVFFALRETFPT